MYTVWLQDVPKVIAALQKKYPNLETFNSLGGNAYGDFIVKTDNQSFWINHNTFEVVELQPWRKSK